MEHLWLKFSKQDLEVERLQAFQEGRETELLGEEFERVLNLDLDSAQGQAAAASLLDSVQNLPIRADYPYREPEDIEGIRLERLAVTEVKHRIDRLEDRVLGAWLGRCAGCLLGKPVEGWQRCRIIGYLKESGQWPLRDYISGMADEQTVSAYEVSAVGCFRENIEFMPEDDDLNYTVLGLGVLERAGADFTTEDVAAFWLNNLPILRTCTAERVAYKNLCNGIAPPVTASFRNPYREWIGAQIRADVWGYVSSGDPALAAELAWRDGRLSHIRNGIYGEMWAAAMISSSFFCDSPAEAIQIGMSVIPQTSRLCEGLQRQIDNRRRMLSAESAIEAIHCEWDERNPHDWCHVISNAEVVAMALLWGEGDFEKSISLAVSAGFDTDCNGATAGSTLGAMLGASRLQDKWTGPLNDMVRTGVCGYERSQISDLAYRTVMMAEMITSCAGR